MTQWLQRGTLADQVQELNKKFEVHNKIAKSQRRPDDIKSVGLPIKQVRLYFIDMIRALFYCHKTIKIIHRDIKPENIGINHNGEAVLIDFGVSKAFTDGKDDTLDENMGSYMFYAPEMF